MDIPVIQRDMRLKIYETCKMNDIFITIQRYYLKFM
jgi:hypothetical protein